MAPLVVEGAFGIVSGVWKNLIDEVLLLLVCQNDVYSGDVQRKTWWRSLKWKGVKRRDAQWNLVPVGATEVESETAG